MNYHSRGARFCLQQVVLYAIALLIGWAMEKALPILFAKDAWGWVFFLLLGLVGIYAWYCGAALERTLHLPDMMLSHVLSQLFPVILIVSVMEMSFWCLKKRPRWYWYAFIYYALLWALGCLSETMCPNVPKFFDVPMKP